MSLRFTKITSFEFILLAHVRQGALAQTFPQDLTQLKLEDLLNIEIGSVRSQTARELETLGGKQDLEQASRILTTFVSRISERVSAMRASLFENSLAAAAGAEP